MHGQIAFAGMIALLMVVMSSALMLGYLHSYKPVGLDAATAQNLSRVVAEVNLSIYPYSTFGIHSDG